MTTLSAIVTLFLVMDPLGNIPVFISTLKNTPRERHKKIIIREGLISFAVMIFFLLFGKTFLALLQIEPRSLNIAGGIVLLIIALKMIFPGKEDSSSETLSGEPFIVPLAIPLISGPSAISMVLIMATKEPDKIPQLFTAVVIASAANIAVLLLSNRISKIMGMRGMIAIERLMGMILVTVSVQMFLNGMPQFLGK
ncbi:MAG: NAAT family transporter [Elusimicrobia bacterium]|nr:NAAT family transporter [Elusimicrobiota bacterium]